jgi:hypothetical protein
MEYSEKLDACQELMSKQFGISSELAGSIIFDLEIEDVVLEYYEEQLEEYEKEKLKNFLEEYEMNKDLYEGDIHGGI